jgi:hypothetical protein
MGWGACVEKATPQQINAVHANVWPMRGIVCDATAPWTGRVAPAARLLLVPGGAPDAARAGREP